MSPATKSSLTSLNVTASRDKYRILYLFVVLALSTLWLYVLITWKPSSSSPTRSTASNGSTTGDQEEDVLGFPSNLEQLNRLSVVLQNYYESNPLYVLLLFSSAYLYKQTFAIPGSVFMNLLAGALFGLWRGFALSCTLTAIGASFCYLLSRTCGKYYVVKYFKVKIGYLKGKMDKQRSGLIYILVFLRLFPLTPNWFLNIASPILDVPLHLFFISVFVGLMPYNYTCVQTGCLLSQLKSLDDVLTSTTLLKLALIAFVAGLPGILYNRFKSREVTQEVRYTPLSKTC